MPQAVSRHITPKSTGHLPSKISDNLSAIIAATRQFISPSIFKDEPHKWTIVVPIRDDRFAPVLRCGEFAVVDQHEEWPTVGGCYWLRFAKSRDAVSEGAFAFVGEPNEWKYDGKPSGLHYRLNYGLGGIKTLDGRPHPDFFGVCMGDNVPADHLRNLIVGRVIGVLGDGNRAINWKGY